jgi:hypothetical protein
MILVLLKLLEEWLLNNYFIFKIYFILITIIMGDAIIEGLDCITNMKRKKYTTLSIILDDNDTEEKQKACAENLQEKWIFGRKLKSITIAYKTDICKNGYKSEYYSKPLMKVFPELLQAIFSRKYPSLEEIQIHHVSFDLDVLSKNLFEKRCYCSCFCCHPCYRCLIPNIKTIDVSYTEQKYRKDPPMYLKLSFIHRLLLFTNIKKFNMLFCQSIIGDSDFFIEKKFVPFLKSRWHLNKIKRLSRTLNFYGTKFTSEFKPAFLELIKGKSVFILDIDNAPSTFDKDNKSLAILKLSEEMFKEDEIEFIAHKKAGHTFELKV